MRILLGREESDAGQVLIDRADTVGYVEQQAEFADGTLYEEFRRAFSDIIALGAQKEEMERHIAAGATEEELSAYGNLVARFEALDGYEFESRIRRVAFGLGFSEEDLTKNVRYFSGGQTTRICLAKALLREPDFLFLDEPTNHLDIKYQLHILELVKGLGIGVIAALHDLNLAAMYADLLVVMKAGRIERIGTPREIITEEMLAAIYGVRANVSYDAAGLPLVDYRTEQTL